MMYHVKQYTTPCIPVLLAAVVLLAIPALFACNTSGILTSSDETISRAGLNSLVLIPVRREYMVGQLFNKKTDFKVLATYSGGTFEIDPAQTQVSVWNGTSAETLQGDEYPFTTPGEWLMTAIYGGKSGSYAVWVLSENGQGGPGLPGNGDTTINIIIR
jgi:hypothetical protein